jgi:hypothetical protein
MIICDLRYPEMHAELATLKSTVHWLVANQNADGSWGASGTASAAAAASAQQQLGKAHHNRFSPSGDAQRSPRALSLLQWYASNVDPGDSEVVEAIGKYLGFILNPTKSKNFGEHFVCRATHHAAVHTCIQHTCMYVCMYVMSCSVALACA